MSVAERLDGGRIDQELGTVLRTEPELWVSTGAGHFRARRAVSCLLCPRDGDRVIVATSGRGDSWVLAVLERPSSGEAEISVDGDLAIRAPKGRVTLAAQHGVGLVSAGEVEIAAGRFELMAREADVVLDQLSYVGELVRGELGKLKLFARTFDSVLERFSQRVKRSYRTVEEHDQVRAEQIDYRAEKTMCLRAENALATARELVKVDGEQIHLG